MAGLRNDRRNAPPMETTTYAAFEAVLAPARLGVAPAELHGSLTGYLCAGGTGQAHQSLAALALESNDAGAAGGLHVLLEDAARAISHRFRGGEAVVLLLPSGPVPARADAMVDWCRGLLGGPGLTGKLAGPAAQAPAVRELLDDLSHVAATRLACSDDDGSELDDVLDFIGRSVAQLHAAFAPVRQQ